MAEYANITVDKTVGGAMQLTDANIKAINSVLAKDQRVELIPTKDGVRVIRIKREEVK